MLQEIPLAPPDAILGLTEAFKADLNPRKVNLGVGVYQDDQGRTPVLASVRAAEERLLAAQTSKAYLPIGGSPEYAECVQSLLFGDGHDAVTSGRMRTAQTPGGTGALRVGADFLKAFLPESRVWLSRPTWPNHRGVFSAARFPVSEYAYYDEARRCVNAAAMFDALGRVPAGDVVVLHACCHNPTGADLSGEQWAETARLARERSWIPFIDFAYQGLGTGIESDRAGLLAMAREVPYLLVASSFSKNFGLYCERTGALSIVAGSNRAADAGLSHVKTAIRVLYSNPPAHGGLLVQTILRDSALRRQWHGEVDAMRQRIVSMRSALVAGLQERGVATDLSFVKQEFGMFSLLGLSNEQVRFLREERSIYMVTGGRINVAGICSANIEYLCDSLAEALS